MRTERLAVNNLCFNKLMLCAVTYDEGKANKYEGSITNVCIQRSQVNNSAHHGYVFLAEPSAFCLYEEQTAHTVVGIVYCIANKLYNTIIQSKSCY